jgi:hypothetical protein
MATGILKNTSVVGLMEESTEGTWEVPGSASGYTQPLADGFDMTPAREKLDRKALSGYVGKLTPRMGMKSVTATLPVELRGSGTEGAAPSFAPLIKSALGTLRTISTTTTTKASGNTGSVLQIEDADISKFAVGDIVCVKQSGGYHVSPIVTVATGAGVAAITLLVAKASGSFSNSVVVSKAKTYYTANSGHPALSLSYYWGNEIVQKAIGCKVASMSVDSFETGQLGALNFSLEGMSYDEANGAAPHTPTLDSGLPPTILSSKVYRDGTEVLVNNVALSLANSLAKISATGNANGVSSIRVSERTISGSFAPYKDDTSVANFTAFNAGTEFSLFFYTANPSSTSGELELGSIVGFYLPKCITSDYKVADKDGVLTDEISFQAVRGTTGSTEELYLGII